MIGTGMAMWFNDVVLFLFPAFPMSLFNAIKEAHAHEALLAFLTIIIWHMYNIHLRANRFPWTWLWVHGRMKKEEHLAEHPGETTLEKL